MKQQNIALLVIDAQNDFHDIPGAALPVPGSVKDTERIATLIQKINPRTIFASQDSHHPLDISHPGWWNKADGTPIDPFTLITADDILNGKYIPRIDPQRSLKYVQALEADKEFPHFIWPVHCEIGTLGQSFLPSFSEAVRNWAILNKKWANFINKGTNPFTEHFGIFRANVPMQEDPATQVNQGIFQALNTHDIILLAGQAQTHCVANSLRQMHQIAPQLAPKIKVLTDCMSPVPGLPADFYVYVDGIYADAAKLGVEMIKSTDL